MEFVPVLAMAALTLKLIDFGRYLRAGDANGVVTQLVVWLSGVIVTLMVAQTDWADGIAIGDMSLGTVNIWSLIFIGLSTGSGASLLKDTHKAVDSSNSSAIPTFLRTRRTVTKPEEVG